MKSLSLFGILLATSFQLGRADTAFIGDGLNSISSNWNDPGNWTNGIPGFPATGNVLIQNNTKAWLGGTPFPINGDLVVGGAGMSGALQQSGQLYVSGAVKVGGAAGTTFTQNGSLVSLGNLEVGVTAGSEGTYQQLGGTSSFGGDILVGGGGNGVLTLGGGYVSPNSNIIIAGPTGGGAGNGTMQIAYSGSPHVLESVQVGYAGKTAGAGVLEVSTATTVSKSVQIADHGTLSVSVAGANSLVIKDSNISLSFDGPDSQLKLMIWPALSPGPLIDLDDNGGKLSLSGGNSLTIEQGFGSFKGTFTLMTFSEIVGADPDHRFDNVNFVGFGYTPQLVYEANALKIVLIPEPGSLSLIGAGLSMMGLLAGVKMKGRNPSQSV